VVLSFALPVPMAALVWFTCREQVMGRHRNRMPMILAASFSAIAVLVLNVVLLLQTFGVSVPGLPS
jgi:manganese transport protein